MSLQCFGFRRSKTPIARSTPQPKSTVKKPSSDVTTSVDPSLATALEEKNISLQCATRSLLSNMIEIQSTCAKAMQTCKDHWHDFYIKNYEDDITASGTIWELFSISVLAIEDTIEKTNESIAALRTARSSITKPKKDQLLRHRINKAEADVAKLKKQLDELEEDKGKHSRKLHRIESNSPSNLTKQIDWETRQEDARERLNQVNASINERKKDLKRAESLFEKTKVDLIEESQTVELERLKFLKDRLEEFVDALDIKTDEIVEKLGTYDPKEDLNKWKRNISRQAKKSSSKSQSIKKQVNKTKNQSIPELPHANEGADD